MRQLFLFILLRLCVNCSNDREVKDDRVLSFPYGTYNNWTNYELKQINFRLGDDKLLIDTTYNLALTDFKSHLRESASDYPMIVNWLKKPTTELQEIQNQLNKLDCDKVNTFWIQVKNAEQVDILKFEWTTGCNQIDLRQLNSVFDEIKTVTNKYKDRE